MTDRAYIAGKITGLPVDTYTDNFRHACKIVSAFGMEPVNPVEVVLDLCSGPGHCGGEPPLHHWSCYMRHTLRLMLTCDVIVLQPNWTDSAGSKMELRIADELGMPSWVMNNNWNDLYQWRNHE